jgi:hypothetical protein
VKTQITNSLPNSNQACALPLRPVPSAAVQFQSAQLLSATIIQPSHSHSQPSQPRSNHPNSISINPCRCIMMKGTRKK